MKAKNIYLAAVLFAVILWMLWNYEVSLELLSKIKSIFMPFILGCSMAFIINILMEKIEGGWEFVFSTKHKAAEYIKRPVALTLSLLLLIGAAAITILLIVPELHSSLKTIAKSIPPALAELNVYLQQRLSSLNLSQDDLDYIRKQWQEVYLACVDFVKNNKGMLLANTWDAAAAFIYMTADIVIGFVVAVYILLEKNFLAKSTKRALFAFCSKENAEYLLDAGAASKRIFTGFVAGQLLEALMLGLLCFIGMLIIGLPYALVISVLVAVMALIPILGTFLSAVIGCVFTLVAAPEKIWWFIIFFLVLQRIEGDILYPKIVGKSVGLSELFVLAAITIGGSIGGIVGIIISVPVSSVIYYLVSEKIEKLLQQKNITEL